VGLLLDLVQQVIQRVGTEDDIDEAGLIASLLIERAWSGASCSGLIEEPFLSYLPDGAEVDEAVEKIVEHALGVGVPHARFVRALAKSNRANVVPVLIGIMNAAWDDPGREDVASYCIQGIAHIEWGQHRDVPERAARSVWPHVRDFAAKHLATLDRQARERGAGGGQT
jgi:hypothetical protein